MSISTSVWRDEGKCPVSEVRDTLQHSLTRTSDTRGH
jgi:hypothetical protein